MIQQSIDKRLYDALYADRHGISSPPHGIVFAAMSKEQALDSFRWCMAKQPAMIEWLRGRIHADLNLPSAVLNYSPQSLLVLWTWMLSSARIEMQPYETARDFCERAEQSERQPDPVTQFRFTYETQLIQLFVSMYFAKCFTVISDRLSWNCCLTDSVILYGQPMLEGFIREENGKLKRTTCFPYLLTSTHLDRVMYGTCRDTDLFSVFEEWKKLLPKKK